MTFLMIKYSKNSNWSTVSFCSPPLINRRNLETVDFSEELKEIFWAEKFGFRLRYLKDDSGIGILYRFFLFEAMMNDSAGYIPFPVVRIQTEVGPSLEDLWRITQ